MLRGQAKVGRRVAVIGAGGIGFDVSEYLLGEKALETPAAKRIDDVRSFLKVFIAFGDYWCSCNELHQCFDKLLLLLLIPWATNVSHRRR